MNSHGMEPAVGMLSWMRGSTCASKQASERSRARTREREKERETETELDSIASSRVVPLGGGSSSSSGAADTSACH